MTIGMGGVQTREQLTSEGHRVGLKKASFLSSPLEQPGAARVEGWGKTAVGAGSWAASRRVCLSSSATEEEVESPLSPEIRNRQQLTRGSK